MGATESRNFYFAVTDLNNKKFSFNTADIKFELGVFYHVVGTYDGVSMKLYIDGVEVFSSDENVGDIFY